ncbi:MarR family transcriptional regulator [Streptomyces sp. NPDC087843]|uniref:MarR family transcriptional regulator n=1 Tax=Streptomyces sp. NPDC087843 TaxID=3365804 RepID=UPI003825F8D7
MDRPNRRWTFLTHHARVLIAIARDPRTRLRDVAASCEITERAVQAVVTDLEQGGYLRRERVGRRNRYTLSLDRPSHHPVEAGLCVHALVELAVGHVDRHQADTQVCQ